MSKIVTVLAAGLIVGLGLSSCKLGRKPSRKRTEVVNMPVVTTPDSNATPVNDSAAAALNEAKTKLIADLSPLWQYQAEYATFSGKARMNYEGKGQSHEFTANFRLRKDSVIWVSVSALGGVVNVARALVTPDSIKAVNYLDKTVYLMKLSDASKLLPAAIDFGSLQNFIVGNALMKDGNATDATDFGGTWTVRMDGTDFIQQLAFNKADSSMRTCQLLSRQENGPAISINYGNYEQQSGRKFAGSRAINILNNGEQSYLDMNFSNANFDQALEFPFSVPSKYKVKE